MLTCVVSFPVCSEPHVPFERTSPRCACDCAHLSGRSQPEDRLFAALRGDAQLHSLGVVTIIANASPSFLFLKERNPWFVN